MKELLQLLLFCVFFVGLYALAQRLVCWLLRPQCAVAAIVLCAGVPLAAKRMKLAAAMLPDVPLVLLQCGQADMPPLDCETARRVIALGQADSDRLAAMLLQSENKG